MTGEIRYFFNQVFAYEDTEEIGHVSLLECAGMLWTWKQEGMELPEGVRDTDLLEYVNELARKAEEAKKAENPLKVYRIVVREELKTSFLVEAHSAEEADAIFESWEDGWKIEEQLIESSDGYEYGHATLDDVPNYGADIRWAEGIKYLPETKKAED